PNIKITLKVVGSFIITESDECSILFRCELMQLMLAAKEKIISNFDEMIKILK
ncbi:hypothetical protein LCGC14_1741270, partial [marine sediment metagenome]